MPVKAVPGPGTTFSVPKKGPHRRRRVEAPPAPEPIDEPMEEPVIPDPVEEDPAPEKDSSTQLSYKPKGRGKK